MLVQPCIGFLRQKGNAIVKSQIANNEDGSRHMFEDNAHVAPQLFVIMLTN